MNKLTGNKVQYFTPPKILMDLGPFDLDPCTAPPDERPWPTASKHMWPPMDGLAVPWTGFVWLNPPFKDSAAWVENLADHGQGIALLPARTETKTWQRFVFPYASAILFMNRRLHMYDEKGERCKHNLAVSPALVAYGGEAKDRLTRSTLEGKLIKLWE